MTAALRSMVSLEDRQKVFAIGKEESRGSWAALEDVESGLRERFIAGRETEEERERIVELYLDAVLSAS